MPGVEVRRAGPADVPGIAACVGAAYRRYIERIGKSPRPILEDYDEVITSFQVHVADTEAEIVGVLVLKITAEGFYLDNVAVNPSVEGTGVGRQLLELAEAEARRQGYNSIYLATHVLMTENRPLYSRIGYTEYDQRTVEGYPRVFLRKQLA